MRAWTCLASWRWWQSCMRETVVVVVVLVGVGLFCGLAMGVGEWGIRIGGVIGVWKTKEHVAFGCFTPSNPSCLESQTGNVISVTLSHCS